MARSPAPNYLHPENLPECMFGICVLFLVILSLPLGGATALLSQSKHMASARLREADHTYHCQADYYIPRMLDNKVTHFFKGNHVKRPKLVERELPRLRAPPLFLRTTIETSGSCSQFDPVWVLLTPTATPDVLHRLLIVLESFWMSPKLIRHSLTTTTTIIAFATMLLTMVTATITSIMTTAVSTAMVLMTTTLTMTRRYADTLRSMQHMLMTVNFDKSLRTVSTNACIAPSGITNLAGAPNNNAIYLHMLVFYVANGINNDVTTLTHATATRYVPCPCATNDSCRTTTTNTDEQHAAHGAVLTSTLLTLCNASNKQNNCTDFMFYVRINISMFNDLVVQRRCSISGCRSAEPEPPVINGTLSGAPSTASDGSKAPSLASQPAVVGMLSGAMRAASDESQALSPASPTPPVVKVMWKAKGLEATSDNTGDDAMVTIVNVSEGCMFLSYEYRLVFFSFLFLSGCFSVLSARMGDQPAGGVNRIRTRLLFLGSYINT